MYHKCLSALSYRAPPTISKTRLSFKKISRVPRGPYLRPSEINEFLRALPGDRRDRPAESVHPQLPGDQLESGGGSRPSSPGRIGRHFRQPPADVGQPAGLPEPAEPAAAAAAGDAAAGQREPDQSADAILPAEPG